MRKTSMRDIVILLPGLTGSILQRDGKDIWAPSGQAIYSALTSQGAALRQLKLHQIDSGINDLDDGISATRLVANFHGIPGLHKMGGYSVLSHLILDHFY